VESHTHDTTEPTYVTREAAQKLGILLPKLQSLINKGVVPAPPLKPRKDDPRFGALAYGQFREWTDKDIELARPHLPVRRQYWQVAPEHQGQKLCSTERVAEKTGIPSSTLLNWVAAGKVAGPSIPVISGRWAGKRLWTDADIAALAGIKPHPYRQTTPAERKRRAAKQYHRDYMNARYATDPEAGRKQVQTSRAKRKTEFAQLQTLKARISKGRPRNNAERRRVLELRSEGRSWGEIRIQMNRETGQNKTAGAYRYLAESI
jgi:hypothetical protein